VTDLDGQVAIVTGGSQGLGAAIARRLASAGARCIIGDLRVREANAVARDIGRHGGIATARHLDVRKQTSVKSFVDAVVEMEGRIDILINNAGIDAPPGFAAEISAREWTDVIDTDLSGQWWCTSAVLPHMLEAGRGRVIFITSVAARIGRSDVSVAYHAAKAGVTGLTIGLAAHVERFGILVNAVMPGPTGTGRQNRHPDDDNMPLGFGGADPIAEACYFLAASTGDWISGAVMNVSGGVLKG
jgi:3-oxoacyl-[acyl-carrier protein] reductase